MQTTNSKYKVKLGIFVSIGILILLVIIFFIGNNQNLFTSKFTINSNFRNVSGLQVGGQVRFLGIAVGTVESVAIINDSTVNVAFVMDDDIKKFIKKDSKASITSEGVIGDKILMISQGSTKSPEVKNGDKINSVEPVEFTSILSSIEVSANNAEVITDELATLLTSVNDSEGVLGKLLNDEKIAADMKKTVENLRKGSKGLEQNMEAAKHNFLLKGYFNKKEREKEKAEKEAIKEQEKREKEKEKSKK
ncbi:MlaD family protein [Flavobacterium algicola]|uniref:MlaD family protein n=1 Tax=Flavobacterium algicola TaxID=556529 RepID=UPI001EFC9169|nr:MlaD family protein [Flavobacterium algicola]MCG9792611.1 MlaD family protein [Flavobacterium algicola]